MASVSCGSPLWTDGMVFSAALGRRFFSSLAVYDQGTAAAVAPGSGVYQAPFSALAVTAPVSGLSVNVSAGYAAIAASAAGQGAYLMGLMAAGSLTVAANSSGNPRVDLVVAQVHDLGSSSSFCDVNIITGTPGSSPATPAVPANAIPLAKVAVANGASNIVTGNITDLRSTAVPPGCVLPVPTAAQAPPVAATQLMLNAGTGLLAQGTGVAGQVSNAGFIAAGVQDLVNTSAGATGLTPGGSGHPWGIGYGSFGTFFFGFGFGSDTDGTSAPEMQVTFAADGTSDYELHFKWQLVIPAEQGGGLGSTITNGQVALNLLLDGRHVDTIFLAATDNPNQSSGGGSASWFTSAAAGTTPSAGRHTATLAVQTASTYNSSAAVAGVFIGDLNDSAVAVFGAGSGYAAALVAENCLLRVMQVPPS